MQVTGVIPHGNAFHTSDVLRFKIVEFTGDGTQNRAVAHGCGKKPTFFLNYYTTGNLSITQWVSGLGAFQIQGASGTPFAVTECDATNIYVGSAGSFAGNENLIVHELLILY